MCVGGGNQFQIKEEPVEGLLRVDKSVGERYAAVRAYSTLGEICGIMRKVFGEYQANFSL